MRIKGVANYQEFVRPWIYPGLFSVRSPKVTYPSTWPVHGYGPWGLPILTTYHPLGWSPPSKMGASLLKWWVKPQQLSWGKLLRNMISIFGVWRLGGGSTILRKHPSWRDDGPATWRIIPVSKWLGSPPFISHLAHLEGEYPYLGDLVTMVINHLLTGMILKVIVPKITAPAFSFSSGDSLTIKRWNLKY